jgi:hypothetical protein
MGRDWRWKIAGLATGVVVVIGMVLLLVRLAGDTRVDPVADGHVDAWSVPETPYLWPENWARSDDRVELMQAQARADAGDAEVAWRLEPEQVVARFLGTVLAWERPDVWPDGPRGYWASPRCPGLRECAGIEIVVDQPMRRGADGVWSVVSVTGASLQIRGLPEGATALPAGSRITLDARALPDGRSGHAGLVSSNGCRESSEFEVSLHAGASTLRVPDAGSDDPRCGAVGAGYLFVYAMDDTTVPIGDPLLEAAAIERPWLTMLPVQVEMGVTLTDGA